MADIDALIKRAEEAFAKHNYDYARDLFLQVLTLDPDHADARKKVKATVMTKFKEQGATSKFKLIALRGQFEIQLKATKDYGKRIDACQRYLIDDPTNSKVRTILAESLLSIGKSNGAAIEAEMAYADDTSNAGAAKIQVAAYKNIGKVKEAQVVLERVAALVPQDRDIERLHRELAAMETMKKGFEENKDYRSVMKNKTLAEELEKKQHLIQSDADFQGVVKSLEEELAANPTDAKIAKRLGDLYFEKKKDYKTAQEWYKKASQLAPQDSVLRDKVDDCAIRIYDVQIEAAQKASDPKLKEIQLARLKFYIQSFERRVADRPTDMGLRFDLGRAYYVGTLVDKAIGEFQQSVKDPKRKTESHFYLGRAFQKKKMFDMADKQYAFAEVDVLSQDRKLDILYNRMTCNAESGNKPKAIELGKQMMEVDISYKDVAELVEKWSNGQ
jgi:tetratricopeptide (TPR) repeat protein